ncbi:MAG: hypothetical protein PHP01_05655 [Phycisphaerae bacterium]|nr:hypothetical protein [Phycisphaerae bacterium]
MINDSNFEKYSSAFTLSDMEIFVFPELMYSLLLANIMSPIVWSWRDADCFVKLVGKGPYKKLMRLKQFIMDQFEFNLDLQTWGLTDKNTELVRFSKYISPEDISKSNALFGYHGDEYYFDIDIRRHFGLDKYDGDAIPYWKTETVEAMEAFRLKPGYAMGAGECVSLAAVYAAAAFVVCQIPLEDIYMVLTPLHSQNFIDINGGVITNNRRLVTKSMWFNGTELSNKAQRAIRNEQVTIVANNTGFVHCFYDEATIDKNSYGGFIGKIKGFLEGSLDMMGMANFLRSHSEYQKYFQFCKDCHGSPRFVKAEVLFHYEHLSRFRVADATHEKLLAEVNEDDLSNHQCPKRIRCDQCKEFLGDKKPDIRTTEGRGVLVKLFSRYMPDAEKFVGKLYDFLYIAPKLPSVEKEYKPVEPIKISTNMSREQIFDYLSNIREKNITADLAFYAYRDMTCCDWKPFIKAAVERNPVSIDQAKSKSIEDCFQWLQSIPNGSIYDSGRLAQPDEVVNYKTGDGVEKAFTLANIIHNRTADEPIEIKITGKSVVLTAAGKFEFESSKPFEKTIKINREEYSSQ